MSRKDSELPVALPMERRDMQRKKVQGALEHDGRPPLPEAARAHVRERSGCQSIVADLTSIVSAAHKLPGGGRSAGAYGLLCTRNWKEKASSVVQ